MAQIRLALNESAYFEFDDVESPLQVYSRADIERVHAAGITLYHPLPRTKEGKPDPALPRDDDGLGIAGLAPTHVHAVNFLQFKRFAVI